MAGTPAAAAEAKQIIKQIKGLGQNLRKQKRLAASILKCGKTKAWLDPERKKEIGLAQSRNCPFKITLAFTQCFINLGRDIRILIEKGLIKKKPGPIDREVMLKRRFRMRMVVRATREYQKQLQNAAEGEKTEIQSVIENQKEGPDLAGEAQANKATKKTNKKKGK